jgi:hypothetical protein
MLVGTPVCQESLTQKLLSLPASLAVMWCCKSSSVHGVYIPAAAYVCVAVVTTSRVSGSRMRPMWLS